MPPNTSFTAPTHHEVATGTLSGLGGMFYVNLNIALNGTGTEFAINDTPTDALRLPNPAILASSSAAFNSGFVAANAIDRNPAHTNTEYASAGQGTNTHLDFDFGSPTNIGYFEIVQRAGDLASAFTLTFADDASFTTGVLTVSVTGNTGRVCLVDVGNLTKQYVKYKVDATAGSNPGALEIAFYNPIPEPASLSLLALGGLLIGFRGHRRKRA